MENSNGILMGKLDYLRTLYLSRGRRFDLPLELIYKFFQFLLVRLCLIFSNLFCCFIGVALCHGIVRLKITKLIIKTKLVEFGFPPLISIFTDILEFI